MDATHQLTGYNMFKYIFLTLLGSTMITPYSIAADNPISETVSPVADARLANKVAETFLSYMPIEVQCDAGYSQFAPMGTLIRPGFTDAWFKTTGGLLNSMELFKTMAVDKMTQRQVTLVESIVKDYQSMLTLNAQHGRISLFMPPNLVDPQDALDVVGYVFGNINSLIIKGYPKEIAAARFKFYIDPESMDSFIDGAMQEIDGLIDLYSQKGTPLYPSLRQINDMVDQTKIDAILKELPTLIGDDHGDLIAKFADQIKRYQTFVAEKLTPHAPQESQLPREIYLTYLRLYGVYDTPEQLIERAKKDWDIYYKKYQDLAREVAQEQGLDITDPAKFIAKLEHDSSSTDTDLVMQRYSQAQANMEEFIRRDDLMTLPQRPIRMRPGTAAEEASFPVPHVNTPNFIGNTGTVWPEFVLCDLAGNSSPLAADPLIVHEGRPGHDLQFSRMLELYVQGNLNLIETVVASNSANAEGWAHYVEYLMTPYMSKQAQLSALKDQVLRIGRMFLDPQLNTQQIGYDDVVKFMTDVVGHAGMAKSEANRYSFYIPGQATSYRYGAIKIMDLRDKLQTEMGAEFTLKAFHDGILSFGLLPVDLYADLLPERMRQVSNSSE